MEPQLVTYLRVQSAGTRDWVAHQFIRVNLGGSGSGTRSFFAFFFAPSLFIQVGKCPKTKRFRVWNDRYGYGHTSLFKNKYFSSGDNMVI